MAMPPYSGNPIHSQETSSPLLLEVIGHNGAEQFMMASKVRLFGDDLALSAIFATDGPKSKDALTVNCATSTTTSGENIANVSSREEHCDILTKM